MSVLEQLNAHTPRKGSTEWHKLYSHLQEVAKLAARFARPFGATNLAYLVGLWHDLGKVAPEFQKYLKSCAIGQPGLSIPHAYNGALYAYLLVAKKIKSDIWPEIVLPILGHHSGLIALGEASQRLYDHRYDNNLLENMITFANLLPSRHIRFVSVYDEQKELYLRMIFSALVDADYLDTEKHFSPKKATARGEWTRPADLWPVFRADQLHLMWNNRNESDVNLIRRQIYDECIHSAKLSPGVFRLMVPTGGGKTRSALAFALRHAVEHPEHHFQRIIVALPYTSIVDQTASEYRRIFGDRLVLEHQSQTSVPAGESQEEPVLKARLASENWDHPLIITTTVQLFESLFNNKPSHCRKLHNIARSIIILDEVQTLPPELLKPTLSVLRDLVDNYGVTIVLSTATQPAFDQTPYLKAFEGISIKNIVPKPELFFQHRAMRRVEYMPIRWNQDLEMLADEICSIEQVMVVFNTRKAALDMQDRLLKRNAKDVYHLSTLLCGEHRRRILNEIKRRLDLDDPQPIRLISTQVVEAGVDLDFPVVYRALGPFDRIVQAAGRCNREGRRKEKGKVIIFDFMDNKAPPGAYKIGLDDSKIILERNEPEALHNPALYTEYFQCLFRDVNLDKRDIQSYRRDFNYPEVAKRYKLIEDTVLVVVSSYNNNEGEKRLQAYLHESSRETFRELMPYTVNIRYDELNREEIAECLEEVEPGLYRWIGGYDDKTHRGLLGILRDPVDLIT
jgi:CRISPR-associated endonuclease/helicase Cas3